MKVVLALACLFDDWNNTVFKILGRALCLDQIPIERGSKVIPHVAVLSSEVVDYLA